MAGVWGGAGAHDALPRPRRSSAPGVRRSLRAGSVREQKSTPRRFRPRLPGPLIDDAEGLGDVIKRVTSAVGIKPCSGCEQRAKALNKRVPFRRASR